jgi:hypothetical protein
LAVLFKLRLEFYKRPMCLSFGLAKLIEFLFDFIEFFETLSIGVHFFKLSLFNLVDFSSLKIVSDDRLGFISLNEGTSQIHFENTLAFPGFAELIDPSLYLCDSVWLRRCFKVKLEVSHVDELTFQLHIF